MNNNEMMIFSNEEFGSIRTIDIAGEIWFVGKDIAVALGYKNTKDAILSHVGEEDKRIIQRSEIATIENNIPKNVFQMNFVSADIPNRGLTIINESGLYALIFGSKLESAKRFKHWVTSEVLPQIRKTGSYKSAPNIHASIALLAQGHTELVQRLDEQQEKLEILEKRMAVVGAFDNEWMLKKIQDTTKSKVLRMTENPVHKTLWSRYFFAGIYKELKNTFHVSTLKSIPADNLESAISIIQNWYPSNMYLLNRLEKLKADMDANLLEDKKIIALLQYLKDTNDGAINPF